MSQLRKLVLAGAVVTAAYSQNAWASLTLTSAYFIGEDFFTGNVIDSDSSTTGDSASEIQFLSNTGVRTIVADAFAFTSLAKGSIGAASRGYHYLNTNPDAIQYMSSQVGARVTLRDRVTFHIADANPNTITSLNFSIFTEGRLDPAGGLSQFQGNASFFVRQGGGAAPAGFNVAERIYINDSSGFKTSPTFAAFGGVFDGAGTYNPNSISHMFSPRGFFFEDEFPYTVNVQGDTAVVDVEIGMAIFGLAGFDHTSGIKFVNLPANVTYTSESGLFMTAAADVPEPPAWLSVMVGLSAVGFLRRRRHQHSLA